VIKLFLETELILNSDGSVYHLAFASRNNSGLTVFTVGDPDRSAFSYLDLFASIEF